MRSLVSCSVFELGDKKEPPLPVKTFESLDVTNRIFLRILSTCAQEENLELRYTIHPFQHLRLNNPKKLNESEFDADIAVCMYPGLDHIGEELGHVLIDRRKAYRHAFIVTQRRVPDGEENLWEAIKLIPQAGVHRESKIYEPIPLQVRDGEDVYDGEEARMISHWNVLKIQEQNSRLQIQSILAII